jgi:hypothetical protein
VAIRHQKSSEHAATKPLDGDTDYSEKSLTAASAVATVVNEAVYVARLNAAASARAYFKFAASAAAPADNATVDGFALDPGESAVIVASGTQLAGIMASGTGVLMLTRIDQ